jgi:hypothetical protein
VRWLLILVTLVAVSGPAQGEAGRAQGPPARRLEPVDEGSTDPTWRAFRARFMATLRNHDRDTLLRLIDPEIAISFGNETQGIDGFRREWHLDERANSNVWEVLSSLMSLGGTFTDRDSFCAPYVSTRFPADIDPAHMVVALRSNVPVFVAPTSTSSVVARLPFAIVSTELSDAPQRIERNGWLRVLTPSGQYGYVRKELMRSPLDYRACFSRIGGRWLMVSLIAGD